MVEIKTFTAEEFATFLEANPVDHHDQKTGICWFGDKDRKFRCADGRELHNHSVGGPDPVRVVVADSAAEATRELERIRLP